LRLRRSPFISEYFEQQQSEEDELNKLILPLKRKSRSGKKTKTAA
jgi:hypothetical protein